jgi:hypothetical protein
MKHIERNSRCVHLIPYSLDIEEESNFTTATQCQANEKIEYLTMTIKECRKEQSIHIQSPHFIMIQRSTLLHRMTGYFHE